MRYFFASYHYRESASGEGFGAVHFSGDCYPSISDIKNTVINYCASKGINISGVIPLSITEISKEDYDSATT